jgi:hypothetical protein
MKRLLAGSLVILAWVLGTQGNEAPAAWRVFRGARTGFVGREGRLLVPPVYARCGDWREGRLWVQGADDAAGAGASGFFLDRQARPLSEARYQNLADVRPELPLPFFDHGVAVVGLATGGLGYLDLRGRLLGRAAPAAAFQRQEGDLLLVEEGGRHGYMDRQGRMRIPARYAGGTPFRGTHAAVRESTPWGLIDAKGAWAVLPAYDELLGFAGEPRFWAYRLRRGWGVMDVTGRCLADPVYDEVGVWHGDVVSLCRKGLWGLLSAGGEERLPPRFATLAPVERVPGAWRAQTPDGRWGVVDSEGRELVACRFANISLLEPGRWIAHQGEGSGVWSQAERRWAVEPRHSRVLPLAAPFAGWVLVEQKGRWGAAELDTGRAALPLRFSRIEPWLGWLAAADGGTVRVFDPSAKQRLSWPGELNGLPPPHAMFDGLGVLHKARGATLITRDASWAWTNDVEAAGSWSVGWVAVRRQGRWGFVDRHGAWTIRPRFEAVGAWNGGTAPVREKGRWGLIDAHGEYRVKPAFEKMGDPWRGCVPVRREGQWGLIDRRGREVLPCAYDGLEWGSGAEDDPVRHGACPPDA